jgi:protein associated with RNAse G/E
MIFKQLDGAIKEGAVRAENEIGGKAITVCTYKYDGSEHRRWRARLLRQEDSLLVLDAQFEEEIRHPLLGTIAAGTVSLEYYWLDRWYNIFRFLQPTGEVLNFYCNINTPPLLHENVLSYIDLDIDILVAPDLSYSILDEDEFNANAARFKYPTEVRHRAHLALKELIALVESQQFPFSSFK